jgi:hypothetical protein
MKKAQGVTDNTFADSYEEVWVSRLSRPLAYLFLLYLLNLFQCVPQKHIHMI